MRSGFFWSFALCWLTASAASAQEGWSREDIVSHAERLLGAQVQLTDVEALPPNLFLLDPTEEASCFVRPGEAISVFPAGEFAQIAIIGNDDGIHTVWTYFPIVGVPDTEAAFVFFKGFFESLLPGWPQAATWAETSLGDAWGPAAAAYRDPMISYNETIARTSVGGVSLATSGVPPDLVIYRMTVRQECEKVSDYLLAKPRRALCDPNVIYPEDARRQVLLYHTRPKPIDRSETPFFLGYVSAQTFQSEELDLDLPAGLEGDAGLNWSEWIPRQVQGELALEQIVSEDWSCASHFTYLISAPDIGPQHPSPWLLSVETVSAYAARAAGEISYAPNRVSALVFSKSAPAVPPRPPSLEPPYLSVREGDLVFETEGDATPVNIGDVPIQLGQIFIGFGQTKFPEHLPIDGRIDGLLLSLTSRSTGASATADLGVWLERQTGVAPAPDRARPISDPSLDFELDGRRFRLVLSAADFEVANGNVSHATSLVGYLFGAPSI